jgi:hypothetical protein
MMTFAFFLNLAHMGAAPHKKEVTKRIDKKEVTTKGRGGAMLAFFALLA